MISSALELQRVEEVEIPYSSLERPPIAVLKFNPSLGRRNPLPS